MTTTDDTALQEQIARALTEKGRATSTHVGPIQARQLAAAVLPVIHAEVARAQAQAWDEGYRAERKFSGTQTPYRTEQNDGR